MSGTPCPDFSLPGTSGLVFQLSAAKKPLIVYFYPKDNTPGCSTENQEFAALYHEFVALGVAVCGVSRDSVKTHQNFAAKLALPFPLLSDRDEVVCQAFAVIKQKQMYGKTVRGIERSTFLITPQGEIIQAWRGVKAAGHAQTVLTALQAHFAAI
ncbi:MAG: peroxiredoxin [Aquaspirillum sp.]